VFCYVLIQDLSSLNSDSFSGRLSHLASIRLPIVTDLGFVSHSISWHLLVKQGSSLGGHQVFHFQALLSARSQLGWDNYDRTHQEAMSDNLMYYSCFCRKYDISRVSNFPSLFIQPATNIKKPDSGSLSISHAMYSLGYS
jgi:hypothetical protein